MTRSLGFKLPPPAIVLLALLSILLTVLACSEPIRGVEPTILAPSNISGQDLSWKDMDRFDFSGKIMQNVILVGASLKRADFTNTDLQKADLTDAIAWDANFSGADLRGAKLDRLCAHGAIWEGAKLDPHWSEVFTLLSNKFNTPKDLQGLDLSNACMAAYDLRGANLYQANLFGSRLSGAILDKANLQEANLENAYIDASFVDANLKDAIVTEEQLERAVLCRTILPNGQISNRDCHLLPASSTP